MEGQQNQGALIPQPPAPQPPTPQPPTPQLPTPQPPVPPATQPATTDELQKHHVHHSYVWLGALRTSLIVLVVMVFSNFSVIMGLLTDDELDLEGLSAGFLGAILAGGAAVLILVIFGLVVGLSAIAYKHLYFTLGPNEFTLYSGIFNKKRVHVPYQRVQSVDQRATLLQRIFGVCTVAIDTAGGASNSAIVVPYLTKQQAEWLRTELYNRKSYVGVQAAAAAAGAQAQAAVAPGMPGTVPAATAPGAPGTAPASVAAPGVAAPGAPVPAGAVPASVPGNVLDVGAQAWNQVGGVFAGAPVDTGRVTYEYGLSNKELFFAGLSNTTSVGLIAIGFIVAILQLVSFAFDVMGDAADTVVEEAMYVAGSQVSAYVIGGISLAVVIGILVAWLVTAIMSCVSYGGFKARRRNSRIEVEYGLLQHTYQGVSVDRVQSVVIKQSFIRRLLGYCELSLGKIDAADDSDDAARKGSLVQEGLVIHPFVKMNQVPAILAGLIPEFADLPQETRPVAKVAKRRAIVRQGFLFGGGFWLAVLTIAGAIGMNALEGALQTGAIPLDPGDEDFFGWLFMFGSGGLYVGLTLAVVLIILNIIGAVLWARESSFAFNRSFMQVSNGGFSRETVSFPRQKIQFGCAEANPLQRRAGTNTLMATTAAGSGGTTTVLIDVTHEDAMAWLDWLKPRGNMVE